MRRRWGLCEVSRRQGGVPIYVGSVLLSVGIESLDNNNLKELHKTWNNPDKYIEAIEALRTNGIMVSTSMMIGLDHDTFDTFRHVFDFIDE